jgi:site-specific DNA-adenine methylase
MKNHFFFSYVGNKREEVEHIYNLLDLENIDTIVEPFCGSCAVSYYIWTLNKDKNYKYILNDLDSNLIELLKVVRSGEYKEIEDDVNKKREEILGYEDDMIEAKKIYLNYIKSSKDASHKGLNNNGDITGYIFSHKYYAMRSGMFPLRDFKSRFKNKLDISNYPIYDFLTNANIEIHSVDANKIIDDYNNDKTFIFLDPPYIASCNNFYSIDTGENIGNIYEKLTSYGLKNYKCKMLICHENNWLFKILFKEYVENENEYKKTYQNKIGGKNKKNTYHICVKNF